MHCEQNMCPICGSKSNHFLIDEANLDFLSYVARKNKINAAVSITRIIWENTSQLRLAANQKTIVDELSNVILEDFQKKADIILTAIQNLIETFSNVAKELPIGIENDFQNTMALFKRELEALKKIVTHFRECGQSN